MLGRRGGKRRVRCWRGFTATAPMFPVTTPPWGGHGTTRETLEGHWDTGKDEFHTVALPADYPLAQPRASYLLIQGQQRPRDPVWFIQSIHKHAGLAAGGWKCSPYLSQAVVSSHSVFPWWDHGWLSLLPDSGLLNLLWVLCGVYGIFVLPMSVIPLCSIEWRCPFQKMQHPLCLGQPILPLSTVHRRPYHMHQRLRM